MLIVFTNTEDISLTYAAIKESFLSYCSNLAGLGTITKKINYPAGYWYWPMATNSLTRNFLVIMSLAINFEDGGQGKGSFYGSFLTYLQDYFKDEER